MPHYFFNAYEDLQVTIDDVGLELPNDGDARKAAIAALTEHADDILASDGDHKDMSIEVIDARGTRLFEASLKFRLTRG